MPCLDTKSPPFRKRRGTRSKKSPFSPHCYGFWSLVLPKLKHLYLRHVFFKDDDSDPADFSFVNGLREVIIERTKTARKIEKVDIERFTDMDDRDVALLGQTVAVTWDRLVQLEGIPPYFLE